MIRQSPLTIHLWEILMLAPTEHSAGKESAYNVRDLGLIPGLGKSRGEGKGCPLQYSGLENPMDYIDHGVARSWTRLSDFHFLIWGFPGGSEDKASACNRETWVRSLGQEDPLEKEMATHSSILAWRIPWMEEHGGLQFMGSQSRTQLSDFTSLHGIFTK